MITVDFIHLVDYAFTVDGKPALIGIFDKVVAPSYPHTQALMALAIQFLGNAGDSGNISVDLLTPGGRPITSLEVTAAVQAGSTFIPIRITGLVLPEPGRYTVRVASKDGTLATKTFSCFTMSTGLPN